MQYGRPSARMEHEASCYTAMASSFSILSPSLSIFPSNFWNPGATCLAAPAECVFGGQLQFGDVQLVCGGNVTILP